jgi:hypothetical protein
MSQPLSVASWGHIEEKKEVCMPRWILYCPECNQDFTHSEIVVPGRPLDPFSWLGINPTGRRKGLAWSVLTARKLQFISVISCYIGRFRTITGGASSETGTK